eukprot:271284-Rhodomonas_salina.1
MKRFGVMQEDLDPKPVSVAAVVCAGVCAGAGVVVVGVVSVENPASFVGCAICLWISYALSGTEHACALQMNRDPWQAANSSIHSDLGDKRRLLWVVLCMLLRIGHAVSSTDVAYAATRSASVSLSCEQ